jgi:glycosyltransferase 2 family protein
VTKLLRLLVSGTLLAWLAWRTDWCQVADAFARLRFDLWLAALGTLVLTQVVSGARWQLLARPLGFGHALRQYVGFYFLGMFFNLLLPTSVGGDVVRAWYLDGGSGRRLNAFLSVFLDRLSGLLVLLTLAWAAVLVCPIELPAWVVLSVWGTVAGAAAGLAALPLLTRWTGRFERVRRLSEGMRLLLGKPRLLLVSLALSLVVQAANVVLVWLVGLAIGAPVPAAYYWVFVPMVSLLTLLPVSLNGMGVREAGMVLFLAPLGVGEGTALTLAFLWFCVFTAASLLGGVVYLFGWFPRPEGKPGHGPVDHHPDQGRTGQFRTAA